MPELGVSLVPFTAISSTSPITPTSNVRVLNVYFLTSTEGYEMATPEASENEQICALLSSVEIPQINSAAEKSSAVANTAVAMLSYSPSAVS